MEPALCNPIRSGLDDLRTPWAGCLANSWPLSMAWSRISFSTEMVGGFRGCVRPAHGSQAPVAEFIPHASARASSLCEARSRGSRVQTHFIAIVAAAWTRSDPRQFCKRTSNGRSQLFEASSKVQRSLFSQIGVVCHHCERTLTNRHRRLATRKQLGPALCPI